VVDARRQRRQGRRRHRALAAGALRSQPARC
jgi:hypothetical protein